MTYAPSNQKNVSAQLWMLKTLFLYYIHQDQQVNLKEYYIHQVGISFTLQWLINIYLTTNPEIFTGAQLIVDGSQDIAI